MRGANGEDTNIAHVEHQLTRIEKAKFFWGLMDWTDLFVVVLEAARWLVEPASAQHRLQDVDERLA